MFVRRSIGVAVALLALTSAVTMPVASAAPAPGDPCSSSDITSPDGTLWCNHQALMWMNNAGGRQAVVGQPCPAVGQVKYAAPEQIVTCTRTAGGLAWEPRG